MKKIRKNVFETNSSSTHSISIARGDNSYLTEIPSPKKDGKIYINSGEYGWEVCVYHNVQDKLSYAATYALNYADHHLDTLTEVIKEFTGAEEVIYDNGIKSDNWGDHGYIDHQSR